MGIQRDVIHSSSILGSCFCSEKDKEDLKEINTNLADHFDSLYTFIQKTLVSQLHRKVRNQMQTQREAAGTTKKQDLSEESRNPCKNRIQSTKTEVQNPSDRKAGKESPQKN